MTTYTAKYSNDDSESQYTNHHGNHHHPVGNALSRDVSDGRGDSERDLGWCVYVCMCVCVCGGCPFLCRYSKSLYAFIHVHEFWMAA